jgi:hypothetical protein
VAISVWVARLFTARGRPREASWISATASSENSVSERSARFDVVRDVLAGLFQIHPIDRAAQRDPLIERGEHALAQLAAQRWLAQQQTGEGGTRVHLGVGQHPKLFELLCGEEVRLVQDEHDGLAALGGLGGKQLGRLRDQRRAVEPWGGAERCDDLGVDPARPDRRVG